jgi:glucokinase
METMEKYYIGIDVGGTKLAYGLFDKDYMLINRFKAKTNPDLEPDKMLDEMCGHIDILLSDNSLTRANLGGVGTVFPSHIDFDNGFVITTSSLPKWDNVPLKKLFSEKLGVAVEVDNDANAAAIAEHLFGAGKGKKHMLYVTVSTGIGGGIILNNTIFRGSYGSAGEFGHMIISDDGYLCGCGNRGCIMSLASGPKIIRYTKDRLEEGCCSTLSCMVENFDDLTCKHIEDAAKSGDQLAIEVIERTGDLLGVMFANLYQIFNVNHFVVGGGVSKFGKPLFDRFNEKFKHLSKISSAYPVSIVPAMLGDDVGIIGAVTLVIDK